jgi:beta-lactamase regulating signal transducer with metallopeptidase domain
MTELLAPLSPFDPLVRMLGLMLLHTLWQCTAIGAIAWLALRALRNSTAQARYAVGCSALAACVLWPSAQLAHALFAAQTTLSATGFPAFDSDIAQVSTSNSLLPIGAVSLDGTLPWVVGLWAVGASAMLLRLMAGLRWVARLRRSVREPGDAIWQRRLDHLADRFGLSRIRFAVLDEDSGLKIGGPLVAGAWRPMVLVPAALIARMPVEMLDALLAHELAHIRRHDYLANLCQRIAEAMLFYHPVVWWLSHRIRLDRELVADDLAASVTQEPRRLALALAELDRLDTTIPSLAHGAHGGHLMSRIQSLLRPQPRASAGIILLPVAGLALACIACLAYAQSAQTRTSTTFAPKVTVGALTAAGTAAASTTPTDTDGTDTYAIVDGDSDRLSMSGSTDEIDAIRAAQAHVDGDFLWFRRDGKAYVLRDPGTLRRVREVWSASAQRDARMEALSAQIQAQADQAEAIGRRMEATAIGQDETPEMRQALDALDALAERQSTLAEQQAAFATTMASNAYDEKAMADAEDRFDALDAQMEKLNSEMESLESVIEAESAKLEADLAPLSAMEDEIEAATAPLEALNAEMEALGSEQELEMANIDQEVRRIVDEAFAKGLASPVADSAGL